MEDSGEGQKSTSSRFSSNFDAFNWMYWSIWWQQYYYWRSYLSQTGDNHAQAGSNVNNGPTMPANLDAQHNVAAPVGQGPARVPQIRVELRMFNGYETYIASIWYRAIAEVIDTALVCVLLKWYIPELDFRVPEALFLGADVVLKMDDEEIEELSWTLVLFCCSIILQRAVHALLAAFCCYKWACTPGKWLMGVRVYNCSKVHYTRTDRGRTIKIIPGTNMTFLQSLARAVFVAVVSLFCPTIIFFIGMDRGRSHYDKLFHTIVVNVRGMYRPVAINNNRQPIQIQQQVIMR